MSWTTNLLPWYIGFLTSCASVTNISFDNFQWTFHQNDFLTPKKLKNLCCCSQFITKNFVVQSTNHGYYIPTFHRNWIFNPKILCWVFTMMKEKLHYYSVDMVFLFDAVGKRSCYMYFCFLNKLRKFTISDFPKQTHLGYTLITLFFSYIL